MNRKILTTKIFVTATIALVANFALAQSLPNSFNYQAVINADDGSPVANKDLTVEISILQGSDCETNTNCPVLWQEIHNPTTNDFGLFTVEIGSTNAINTQKGAKANYSDIDWLDVSNGYYYLHVRADFGQSEFLNGMNDLGISKFSAVPYALVALTTDLSERSKKLETNSDGKIAHKLNELSDVDVDDVTDTQILTYNATTQTWQAKSAASVSRTTALSQLEDDVAFTGLAQGNSLYYDGSKWKNKTLEVNDLLDVSLGELSKDGTGDFLYYDNSAKKWTNHDLVLNDIAKVLIGNNPTAGQVLTYNGTIWENADAPTATSVTKLSELTGDVSISSPTNGQVLTYNTTSKKWEAKTPDAAGESLWTEGTDGIYYNEKNVGIGTSNPKSILHIYSGTGNTFFTGQSIIVGGSESTSNDGIVLGSGEAKGSSIVSGGGKATAKNSIAFGTGAKAAGNNSIAVGTNCTASAANSMAIGNGTTTPALPNSVAIGRFNKPDDADLFSVGYGTEGSPKNVFSVDVNGNAIVENTLTATTVTQSSDIRLKKDITTIESALDKVMKMRGVTYFWDKTKQPNASNELQYGVVAQELEKIVPSLVTDNGVNGYKAVNYNGLTPILIEAVKEQQAQIENLQKENTELKNTLDSLLKRIEALENK